MENPLQFHQPLLQEPHPAVTQSPSLLERLKEPEISKPTKTLRERLSIRLKPWLNRSERGKRKSHKLSLRSVKSLPQIQEEMMNLNQIQSIDTLAPLTESKPKLLNRINMEQISRTPSLENERMNLIGEVNDMMNLD